MRIVSRLLALSRSIQLNRQFREIHKEIDSMPLATRRQLASLAVKEFANASQCEYPHLYGTPAGMRYLPWGMGTQTGFERVQSDNLEVRLRGIALWLAVVFHETRDSPHSNLLPQQRNVLRVLRELKPVGVRAAKAEQWMATA